MKLHLSSFRAMSNPLKQSGASLSTSASRLDQAYRTEADTFGELKVSERSSVGLECILFYEGSCG